MKIAYLDTIAGISGDMTLGAFVSAGVSIDELSTEIGKLNLEGVELQGSHIERSGIDAVKIDVVISTHHENHRQLLDIFSIIDGSSLSKRVKTDAKKIFGEVARAEATVHGTNVEQVHFHEVGLLDSIVDIVGTAICLEKLSIDAVYSSPVKLGSGGFVETEHGKLPLPGPATIEILKNYPTVLTDVPFELTTPTGAAIIKAMSSGTLSSERMKVESVGYGAGTREFAQIPNLLRVMIGELIPNYQEDEVVVVETNIDDMNPEIYPFVIERLLNCGALDSYIIPLIMKKGRPGIVLHTLVDRARLDDVLHIVFSETTTLGVRIQPAERRKVARAERGVKTTFGTIRVKAVTYEGKERLVPEYEECRRIAVERKLPLRVVYEALTKELSL